MFGLFKKKTKKQKLLDLYKKKKEEAYKLSRINRIKGDEKEKEANEILNIIEKFDKEKNI